MFWTGIQIMLVGMGTVFGFLILMVWVMIVAAHFLKKFPEAVPVSAPRKSTAGGDGEIAAAIAIVKSKIG